MKSTALPQAHLSFRSSCLGQAAPAHLAKKFYTGRLSRGRSLALLALFAAALQGSSFAQDRTVTFGVADAGVSKAITEWGLDTVWPSSDNMRRGIAFMGADQVDVVRVAFPVNAPLVSGALTTTQLANLTTRVNLANLAGAGKPLTMTPDTEAGVDPWYKNGTEVVPSRWVQAMEATVRALAAQGKTVVSAAPFNEPDYGWGQGTVTNLYDILGVLQTSPEFAGVPLAGASTLSCDAANTWYNAIKNRVTEGTTHQLAGSFDNYVSFYQNVRSGGNRAVNEELHNVCEAIVGVEYGLQTGIWWGSAELARGEFVKSCQGVRLGYAEHRPNWTAAAVYRAPGGKVQAFVGASERQAVTTSYRFVSKDRDVFFDGVGPQRDYTVTVPGGTGYWVSQPNAEKLVNITWGADVQPAITSSRYILVNRNSGKVMEVAGAGMGDGANIQQATYTGVASQQWDIAPLDSRSGGDYSYFTLKAAHSGKSLDLSNWSLNDGGNLLQWGTGSQGNEQWFFDYTGDGWFTIRSRWSGKYLDIASASTADGASIQQWSALGTLSQQWRLLPAGSAVEFVAPAAPTGLATTANRVSVNLTWNASAEADLAGYNVLRADTSGGPYSLVARGLAATTFTDKSANQNRAYYYVVQAADRSLNCSGNSAQVSATPSGAAALVARFDFDSNTDDGSGNANHATLTGTATYGSARLGTSALTFDGSTHVNLPGDIANFNQLTVAAWVYWNGGAASQRIFDFGTGTDQYLFLTPTAAGAGLRFAIKNGGAEQTLNASALATGQWVHVAITLGASGAELYVNGVSVASSAAITIRPADFKPMLNYVGKSQSPDPLFNGRIDDFRIYNYALAASSVAELATGSSNTAPAFTTQPASQTVNVGTSVTFTTAASGSPAPTFQWQKNGVDIAGATNSSYVIASVTAGDAGSYTVVATNSASFVTSNAATLTVNSVNTAPVITTQPTSQTVVAGASVTFTAAASGTPVPTFQWQKNGVNIGGATNSSYTIASVAGSDSGNYTVIATNSLGSATSAAAVLLVVVAPSNAVVTITVE